VPELVAWVNASEVGRFTERHRNDGSHFSFDYFDDADAGRLVSLTMIPLADRRRFESRQFPPAFDMILPEGQRRQRIEAARKIVRTDDFALLTYVGGNPINRVRFLPPGVDPYQATVPLPSPKEIANCSAGQALFQKLMAEVDLRQGIAGVQPKVLGAAEAVPKMSPELRQERGNTHILKASTTSFPYLAVNEYICLKVFESAGLAVPAITLSADGELLLVERFDTLKDGTHLGFEEVAVLMGETSASKYQRDYGSMIESLASFVEVQAEDTMRRDVTMALVLNWLLGNGDAHLKNFGVLYQDDLDVRLAPFYDVVSTLPYIPEDVPALALSFEWYSKAWWPRARLEEFAQRYGKLTTAETARMIDRSMAAVDMGVRLAEQLCGQIDRFGDVGAKLVALWQERMATFAA
jgi:serine/threonine-protein kinase HipA